MIDLEKVHVGILGHFVPNIAAQLTRLHQENLALLAEEVSQRTKTKHVSLRSPRESSWPSGV